jgi:hypothetical protein
VSFIDNNGSSAFEGEQKGIVLEKTINQVSETLKKAVCEITLF